MNVDIKISEEPLSIDEIYDFVLDDYCGAVVLFIGTVRNHLGDQEVTHLDFQAYESMAISEMKKIADRCRSRYPVVKLAIHHKKGMVKVKEKAVIIGVSAPHRKEAFEACEFLIDELKKTVTIWKKEFFIDGSHWVNAHP